MRKCFPDGLLRVYEFSLGNVKKCVEWFDINGAILLASSFLVISLYDLLSTKRLECGVIEVGELVVGYQKCNVFKYNRCFLTFL